MDCEPHTASVNAAFVPAVTRDQVREVDRLMVEEYHVTILQMMEHAGRNLAELAGRMLGALAGRRICVVAGAGNNGGGALAAARHASNRGAQVQVVLSAELSDLGPAAARHAATLRAMGIAVRDAPSLPDADLYVDGIVGYSRRGPLRGRARDLAGALNAAPRPTLSLDVPTGLDADTGDADARAVRAAATMTLALPKPGLLLAAARPFVGALYLADIGVPPQLYSRLGVSVGPVFSEESLLRISHSVP